MRLRIIISTSFIMLLAFCKPNYEKISTNTQDKLSFSTDTIYFDTLFSANKSVTMRLKVYNKSSNAVKIDRMFLGNAQSEYKVYINGLALSQLSSLILYGGDSLLVLVEVQIANGNRPLPFLVEDSLSFITNSNLQKIKLIAYGQDAYYHREVKISKDTNWLNDKPHVVIGIPQIDSSATLTIQEGSKIYFANNSGLEIKGKLLAQGKPDKQILFAGNRLEDIYNNQAGQWYGLIFNKSSSQNVLEWVELKNAKSGITIENKIDADTSFKSSIKNTIIKNMDNTAIYAKKANIIIQNCVITNCANAVVTFQNGGNISLVNNTITNFGLDYFRTQSALVINKDQNDTEKPLSMNMYNNIIWGNLSEEITIDYTNASIKADSNIIRGSKKLALVGGNQYNSNRNFMKFKNIFAYDFTPDSLSPAIDKAMPILEVINNKDAYGNSRDSKPDIGAIERKNKK